MFQKDHIRKLAAEIGFELCGFARAEPVPDAAAYHAWKDAGMAAGMGYLTDRRADVRDDPRNLLASARTIICLGRVYNSPVQAPGDESGWISRYAWGDDYHDILRADLTRLAIALGDHQYKVCVDTAPLLERSYARLAGLGWIGRNTCLINQKLGSWVFLGEILTSLPIEPDGPPPDRCGTCRRCIEACPTDAIVGLGDRWAVDSRLCISYHTIEHRGPIPEDARAGLGRHIFGCDICQDVCPWNRRAAVTEDVRFAPREAPDLHRFAQLTELAFREMFRGSPVSRAKYSGFLRNVALAMGNAGDPKFLPVLEKLVASGDVVVSEAAQWALNQYAGG